MKNMVKLIDAMRSIAIIALVAVIGFSMAGCDDDLYKDDSSTDGRLTITGLNDYKGCKISGYGGVELNNGDRLFFTYTNGVNLSGTNDLVVNGDSAELYVWIAYESKGAGALKNYTGNDKNISFNISITREIKVSIKDNAYPTSVYLECPVTVNFSKGKASAAFAYTDAFTGTWIAPEYRDKVAKFVAKDKLFKLYYTGELGVAVETTRGTYYVYDGNDNGVSLSLSIYQFNMRDPDEQEADEWVYYEDLLEEQKYITSTSAYGTITGNQVEFDYSFNEGAIFTKQ